MSVKAFYLSHQPYGCILCLVHISVVGCGL